MGNLIKNAIQKMAINEGMDTFFKRSSKLFFKMALVEIYLVLTPVQVYCFFFVVVVVVVVVVFVCLLFFLLFVFFSSSCI